MIRIIPYSTLCVLAVVVHHVSSDIEIHNKNSNYIRSFTSDVTIGNPYDEPLRGLVVLADPPDACSPIKKVDFCCNMTQFSKFVLVAGSTSPNCTVQRKIENAANADFDLAILYGEKIFWSSAFANIYWGSSGGDDDDVTALKISHNDGEIIKLEYLFQNNTENYFYLTVVFKNRFQYYLMVFAAIIALCFIVIIFFMVCLCAKYIQERQRSRRNRLSSRQIKQLPTEKYTKDCPYDVCAICIENYIEGEKLRVLPCAHAYHTRCVDPWLMENKRNCPLCKRKVHMGDTSSESDSDSDVTSATESTPLVSPTNAGNNSWGTFAGPSTSGEQSRGPVQGTHLSLAIDQVDPSRDDTDSSESDNIIILPSTTGSVNAAYEDDVNDIRPKSV